MSYSSPDIDSTPSGESLSFRFGSFSEIFAQLKSILTGRRLSEGSSFCETCALWHSLFWLYLLLDYELIRCMIRGWCSHGGKWQDYWFYANYSGTIFSDRKKTFPIPNDIIPAIKFYSLPSLHLNTFGLCSRAFCTTQKSSATQQQNFFMLRNFCVAANGQKNVWIV